MAGCRVLIQDSSRSHKRKLEDRHAGSGAGSTLTADTTLDLRAAGPMQCIREFIRHFRVTQVIVDPGLVWRIRDSGRAMLLLLKHYPDRQLCSIHLVNLTAAIRNRWNDCR